MDANDKIDGRTLRAQRTHASVHAKILQAVRDIAAEGVTDIAPAKIASRAGVSATTIYNHFPRSTAQILDEMIEQIFSQAAANAEALVAQGKALEAVRAVTRTFAVELVKLGLGGRLALSHHYDALSKDDKEGEMFENFVFGILSNTSDFDSKVAHNFTRYLGVIVRGLHSTWANFPATRLSDAFVMSDEEFVELHLRSVDLAMVLATSK
jgi:AcrR family transcriptional regulator